MEPLRPRPTRRQKVGYAAVMLAVGLAFAALGVSLSAKDESSDVSDRVAQRGPPCVDANGGEPGIVPSRGCRRVYRTLVELCVQDPGWCRRSQRRAVRHAQAKSVAATIGPSAQLLKGGGGSKGNKPQSQPTPPSDNGGGGGNGSKPATPSPGNGGGNGNSNPPPVTKPDLPNLPLVPTIPDVPDVCKLVDPPIGPPVQVCP